MATKGLAFEHLVSQASLGVAITNCESRMLDLARRHRRHRRLTPTFSLRYVDPLVSMLTPNSGTERALMLLIFSRFLFLFKKFIL